MKAYRRLPWILLVASLSLNVLLVSYGATLMTRMELPVIEATSAERVIRLATAVLPGDEAARVEADYAARQPQFAAAEAGVRAVRRKVLEMMLAPTIDPVALRTALEEGRAFRRTTSDLVFDMIVAAMQRMPVEQRQALVERFGG